MRGQEMTILVSFRRLFNLLDAYIQYHIYTKEVDVHEQKASQCSRASTGEYMLVSHHPRS